MSAGRAECLLCGGEPGPVVVAEGGHTLRRCGDCGLLFVSPRPPPEEISAIYEHDAAHTASRQQQAKSRDPIARQHARHALGLLPEAVRGAPLLELGPGGGSFLAEASEAGFLATGVEPNPVQVAFLREQGLRCLEGGVETLPDDARFSVVYHCNVLSHLPDPVGVFARLRQATAEGGVMLFETGNYGDVDPSHHALIARTETFQLPDHLAFYGARSLDRLLERSGWERIALHRYSRIPEKWAPRLARPLGLSGWVRAHRHDILYGLGAYWPGDRGPETWMVLARPKR